VDIDVNALLASLLVSSVGFVLLVYGKKMARPPQLGVGMLLVVFPYFVSGALWILLIATGLLTLMWIALKNGW
jgi:hypothetical protein